MKLDGCTGLELDGSCHFTSIQQEDALPRPSPSFNRKVT